MTTGAEVARSRMARLATLTALFFALALTGVLISCNKSQALQQTAQTGTQALDQQQQKFQQIRESTGAT